MATKNWPDQRWHGMDGATAYHLIERHADGWSDVGEMMDAWLAANAARLREPAGVGGEWVLVPREPTAFAGRLIHTIELPDGFALSGEALVDGVIRLVAREGQPAGKVGLRATGPRDGGGDRGKKVERRAPFVLGDFLPCGFHYDPCGQRLDKIAPFLRDALSALEANNDRPAE